MIFSQPNVGSRFFGGLRAKRPPPLINKACTAGGCPEIPSLTLFTVPHAPCITISRDAQVLGHVKTVCIIATGYLLFNAPLTKRAAAGTCIALVAVGMYTWIKNQRAPNSTPDSKFEVPPLERVPDDYAPLKSSGARPNPPRSPAGRAEALPGIPVASDGAALCR